VVTSYPSRWNSKETDNNFNNFLTNLVKKYRHLLKKGGQQVKGRDHET
jgi:hypothetical protein